LSWLGLNANCQLIRHGARGNEEAEPLAQHRSGHVLKPIDGRVFAIDVIAHVRAGHRLAHLIGRFGDGVTTKIDHPYGLPNMRQRIVADLLLAGDDTPDTLRAHG